MVVIDILFIFELQTFHNSFELSRDKKTIFNIKI